MKFSWKLFLLLFFMHVFSLQAEKTVIRVGHFPNITHAQGVVAHGLTRQNQGWFEERLGSDVDIQWFVYNAGPDAMEAIFAESIELTYVGPGPTINAYLRSKGKEIRVVCGACSGGAALVVQPDEQIKTNADFKGKKIGTPQLGNTQDIAARSWLRSLGYKVRLTGGDVLVIPTQTFDQLLLFKTKQLDAIWTIEPWVSRLILEAGGSLYFNESVLWPETDGRYVTTHLVSGQSFLEKHPDLMQKWIAAHVELTQWINEHPKEAKALFNQEIKAEMKKGLSEDILDRAWEQLQFTYDPIPNSLFKYAQEAYQIGFLNRKPEFKHLYQLQYLENVLKEKPIDQRKEHVN